MSEDNSEYSVNDQPQAQPQQAQSCPANGGCCCKHCPLNSLAPENIEATLQRHSAFIDEFQGAVFFRRPIAFAALIVSVNLTFFLYRKLNLNFYALLSLLGIIYIGVQIIPSTIISTVKSVLFPGQLDKGSQNDLDRIRDTNELVAPINTILGPIFGFIKIVNALSQDQSVTGLLIYGSVFFCFFCITASVDFFWPIVILTNFALILPCVLTRPQVVPYVQKAREHLKSSTESVPEGNAPSGQDVANRVSDALNQGAQQVSDAVNQGAQQVADAVQSNLPQGE